MRTIEAEVIIGENGEISIQATALPNVPSGHYRAVVVIEENPALSEPDKQSIPSENTTPLRVVVSEWENWSAETTFSREDIYENDDR